MFYTYADGPRKGKRDKEEWNDGEMVSSVKFYGGGDEWEVKDWEDLKKMEDVTKSYCEMIAPSRNLA